MERVQDLYDQVFQDLYDQLTQAMEKNTKLKPVLGFLQATLNCLRSHQIFNEMIKDPVLVFVLFQGANLMEEVSKLRPWHYIWCLDDYTKRLVQLDRELRFQWILPKMKKFETVPLKKQVAAQAAVRRLFEAVQEGRTRNKDLPLIILRLLYDIDNTIKYYGDWSESRLRSMEEVRSFTGKMNKGLEVVRRSCRVGKKTKYDSVTGLLDLSQPPKTTLALFNWD